VLCAAPSIRHVANVLAHRYHTCWRQTVVRCFCCTWGRSCTLLSTILSCLFLLHLRCLGAVTDPDCASACVPVWIGLAACLWGLPSTSACWQLKAPCRSDATRP
jgi:hypothetical protein